MTREEIRLQVAISVIQGVLEAKHGVIGEVVPSVAVAIALRIADAFVEEWYRETKEQKPAGGDSEKPNSQWSEERTCKTCGYYENNCPFIRGKLIPYPSKVCNDYTYSVMKAQEQPEVDLEKFTEKIKTFQGRYKYPEILSIKGAMAFMARMFYQYPHTARQWYESLPKATMD